VYAVALLALIMLGALLVTRPWADDGSATDDGTTESSADPGDTVRVRRAAYVGEPVGDVVSALENKDLETETETRDNPGDQEPGTVADLNPTGRVERGATITLQVWGDPPDETTEEPTDGETTEEPSDEQTTEEPTDEQTTEQPDPGDSGTPGEEKPPKPKKSEKPAPPDPGNGDPSGGASPGAAGGSKPPGGNGRTDPPSQGPPGD
jgi:hypothetical protein